MNENWKIGDELRNEEINANVIIVGIYKNHYECIAFNDNDFDTFIVPLEETFMWNKTYRNFSQIAEMIKIIKRGNNNG
jgi:hypothetical protein